MIVALVILNIFRHYTVMHLVGLSYHGFQTVARRVQPDRKKNGGPIPVDFQSTLKCMTVECLRMLSITTLQTTIMTLQLFSKFVITSQYYEYN